MLYNRNIHHKKSLGQHFLKDSATAERIVQTVSHLLKLPILEVGPGMGMLTQFLLRDGYNLKIIELDDKLVRYLKIYYPTLDGYIIQADFLKTDLNTLFDGTFCIIGNYPYNISSQIFFKVLEYKDKVNCCAGMIQKEMAERLVSPIGKKTYGIISVLLQAWYNIEFLFTVEPDVFDPPPKVKSAVIRMTRNNRLQLNCDEILFRTIVKTAFNQRRKTMRNSLKYLLGKGNKILTRPIFDNRPEQLSVEDFIDLTQLISLHSF